MRFTEIKKLIETVQLDEVSMSPSTLQKFLNGPESDGMMIGIEFEMAVPNVDANGEQEPEWETDYDYNESCGSIDEIIAFFRNGDFSNMSRSDADRYRDDLANEYWDWQSGAMSDYLDNNELQLLDNVRSKLDDEIDRDAVSEEAHTRWVEEHPKGDPTADDSSQEIRELTLQMIEDALDEMMLDASSREYERAFDGAREEMEDDFRNNDEGDEETWLRDIGVRDMQDAEGRWNFDWPHMIDTQQSNGGDLNVDDVADEFAEAMGLDKVNSSDSYHGARRDGVHWCIEPDSSIKTDDGDGGLEFISPPLPLKDGLEQMHKIIAWANDKGCYTNKSTGLHMNISVPNFKLENLDYVKLALFMGDEHILKEFGRSMNNYCKSALSIVKEKVADRSVTDALLKQMREHLNIAASKAVHNGTTNKFTSINTKGGYVEFRGPGGDYLSQDINKLINTALRLAQSLRIAIDPLAHKQEYAKKLYKLASPVGKDEGDNSVAMFSRYAMGDMKKDELLEKLRKTQADRKVKKFPNGPKRVWTVARKSNPGYKVSFNAVSAEEALQLAKNQVGGWAGVADEHFKVTADATGDSAFNKAREEHYLATMDPMWQKFIRDIATIPTERLKKRKIEFEAEEQTGYTPGAFPEWKKIVLARINKELATREGGNEPYNPVDNVEELSMTWQEFVRDIQNKTHDRLTTLKTGIEQHDHGGFTDVQKTILLNAINNELARRTAPTTGQTLPMPSNLSNEWQRWLSSSNNRPVNELQRVLSVIASRSDMTDEQKDYVSQELVAELDRRAGTTTGIDDLEAIASDTLAQTSTWQLYDPATDEVVATYTGLTQSQAADRRDALRRANGDNIEMRNLGSAEQSTAQASTGSSLWDNWISTLPTRNTGSINDFRDQIRAGQHDNTLTTEHERDVVVIAIDDELRRRRATTASIPPATLPANWKSWAEGGALLNSNEELEAVKARMLNNQLGRGHNLDEPSRTWVAQQIDNILASRTAQASDVSQVLLQPADLPETWSNWVREMNSTTNEVLNTMKGHLEHIQSGVNINLLPPIYRRLTERQVPYLLQQINNTLASRTAATTDTSDDDGIPENWRNWVDTLANRPVDSITSIRAEIQSSSMNVGLEAPEARAAVIRAIDDELRRRQATSDLADGNATGREIFDSLGPVWQNWLQSISNLQDHMLEGMIRTIEAESGDIVMLTVRQRAFIKSTIHQELRRRASSSLPANSPAGRPDWNDISSSSEVAGTRTYTIYDSMDRIVNTIRSTSAARALDEFGENNDIDTTHYTARPIVQQAADHVIPTPGPGQSWYSVEHIPTGQVTRVIGNDAADAIQRQATATGGLPISLRIAQATPYADDADERERMRGEREQISQDMAQQDEEWQVGNHTYGREIIRAPNREEAIRLFAHNNGISVDDVTSGPSFIAHQLTISTNESIDLIRKLAGLK